MTIQKDDIQMRKAVLLKAARNAIRFKHSVLADEELNIVLPYLERRFTALVQAGEVPNVKQLLADNDLLS